MRVSQRVTPLETIGCYVPGGRFSLVSTLLMSAVPAQVAGVKRIVVVCPRPNAALLAAARLLGVYEIARIGGAQAIAALAYGTRSVPRVDKIFGPGNRYVTAAKRLMSADCAVDMLAGPTEVLIVAQRGNARYIASDLVAQAEHDPDAVALLVTTSRKLAAEVRDRVSEQLSALPPDNPARRSLTDNGAILIAPSAAATVRFANQFAPEHLSVPDGSPALLRQAFGGGQRVRRAVERAERRRLRQRHQSRAADQRRRAVARRPFDVGFRALHQRAATHARRVCRASRRWSPRWRRPKAWWRTGAPSRCAGEEEKRASPRAGDSACAPVVKRLAPYVAPEEGRAGKLRLDFNENTVGCSPAALRALRRMTSEQLCIYPEYEASQRRLARHFGVRPAEMLFTNGVDDALRLLMDTFVEPGNTVLLPEPTFTMYRFYAEIAGARIATERYDADMRFPLEAILRALQAFAAPAVPGKSE